MSTNAVRAATYLVVAILALTALRFTPPLPERKPAEVLMSIPPATPPESVWTEHVDTLGRGETLIGLLARGGVQGTAAVEVIQAAKPLDARRVRAGMPVVVRGRQLDSLPSEVVFHLGIDRLLRVRRTDDGWVGEEERLPWTTDTIAIAGVITSNLYDAMEIGAAELLPAGARSELAWTIADILEYRVDMSRDLQQGDAFRVLVERSRLENGHTRVGAVVATTFTLSGSTIQAIRFESEKVRGGYFDQEGRSLRAGFLRAPLQFRRISSVFGRRKHPVLKTWRQHRGLDYAASSGTPVRAIGDGTVIYAGWRSGYGNTIEIRHRNGYVSRYGHLRGFAKSTRRGGFVAIGTTIGYVGQTGLATGPHLHFEVLVNGVQRDPRTALRNKSGEPIPAAERERFHRLREQLIAQLEQAVPAETTLAAR